MTKRTFTREFKLSVARQLVTGEKRISQVCREHALCQTLVRNWREQYEQQGENAWLSQNQGDLVGEDPAARIAALEAALGRATLENHFLRHALATLRKGGSALRSNGK
jgi:transposase-like protein